MTRNTWFGFIGPKDIVDTTKTKAASSLNPFWKACEDRSHDSKRWAIIRGNYVRVNDQHTPIGKSVDMGVTGDGGHWVTINGNHILIGGNGQRKTPHHRHSNHDQLTRADFEADVKKGPDAFFRSQLRTKEHGNNLDRTQDKDKTHGPLGHYQFLDSTLVKLGLKQQLGNNGWETTNFSTAYGIKTNQDFLNNDGAQDAALAQFAKRVESEIKPLQQYIGHKFLTADGMPVTVTQAGLFAAIHKQGGKALQEYFEEYGKMILSDDIGDGLNRTRAYDDKNKDDDGDRNVEGRLHWAQYITYDPQW